MPQTHSGDRKFQFPSSTPLHMWAGLRNAFQIVLESGPIHPNATGKSETKPPLLAEGVPQNSSFVILIDWEIL